MSLKLRHVFLLFFVGISQFALAQGQGQSPYSSIGLGEIVDETNAVQDMMGGTGVSFTNTFYINSLNPALLAKDRLVNGLKYVAFNVSGKGYFRNLQQEGKVGQDFGLNLSNLGMAFPIVRRWTVGVNFRPYSIVDNENIVRRPFWGSSSIGSYDFKEYGGLSRVGLTNSFNIAKGLYVGVEGQYYFGNITRDTTIQFINTGEVTRYSGRHSLKGVSLKGGVAYQHKISKKWKANIGATYQIGNELKGDFLNVFQSYANSQNGVLPIGDPDTLSTGDFSTSLPAKYKIGVSIEKNFNWVFAAEYGFTDWEGTSKPFDNRAKNSLRNSKETNLGIEWIPNVSSGKYFNQVFYRVGYKNITTPYYLSNTQIVDNSFSLGMSLPLGRGGSYLDLAMALGRRGTMANNLVKENYAKISVSFSFVKDWFHRPKIQ